MHVIQPSIITTAYSPQLAHSSPTPESVRSKLVSLSILSFMSDSEAPRNRSALHRVRRMSWMMRMPWTYSCRSAFRRAVPRRWLASELSVDGALTRWGRVTLQLQPSDDLRHITARITLDGDAARPTVMLRVRHPNRLRIATCDVTGGACERIDAEREVVRLRLDEATAVVTLGF